MTLSLLPGRERRAYFLAALFVFVAVAWGSCGCTPPPVTPRVSERPVVAPVGSACICTGLNEPCGNPDPESCTCCRPLGCQPTACGGVR